MAASKVVSEHEPWHEHRVEFRRRRQVLGHVIVNPKVFPRMRDQRFAPRLEREGRFYDPLRSPKRHRLQAFAADLTSRQTLESGRVDFELVGDLTDIETIAAGRGIRDLARLRRLYGKGYWRKMKGRARIDFGTVESASLNCTGMKRTASAKKNSSARGTSTRRRGSAASRRFAVCVRNDG